MLFKNYRILVVTTTLLLITQLISAQTRKVRIACIGNSITYGYDLNDPSTEAYPAQLQKQLSLTYGNGFLVKKFAVSARTLLKQGDLPIWNEPEFSAALNYTADITIIMLGTNDTKSFNWDNHQDEFIPDYKAMLDTLLLQNQEMKFFVCYPPPAFVDKWGIRDSVIVHGVMPAIDTIRKYYQMAYLIDFYHAFKDSGSLFPDHIHPNIQGSIDIATVVMKRMSETGLISSVNNPETINHCFLDCYPNPANNVLKVKLINKEKQDVHWDIINCTGSVVSTETVSQSGSNEELTIKVAGLHPGSYVLIINIGEKKFVTRFFKK